MVSVQALLCLLVHFSVLRVVCGVERHGHSHSKPSINHADRKALEVGNDAKIIHMDKSAPSPPLNSQESMMRHEPAQHAAAGARTGGSVLVAKANAANAPVPAEVTQYKGAAPKTHSVLAAEPSPNVTVPIQTLQDAEAEADKVGKLITGSEAEAGMPDTVHTTPIPLKEDDSEEQEEKALMWIAISLIVVCCAWSAGWVIFMRRFASKKDQIKAGLLSEDAAEEDGRT